MRLPASACQTRWPTAASTKEARNDACASVSPVRTARSYGAVQAKSPNHAVIGAVV